MLFEINGHTAYCYTGGKSFNPALHTIVFIHGAQNDHSVWGLQTRYLAHHGFNVLAVDLPGHGRSKGEALKSVEQMAEWLVTLLDVVGIQQATLVGHSMGSLIALETCHKASTRVSKLVLVGTAYPMRVSDTLLNAARDEEQTAIDMVNIWSHTSIAHKPSCPGPGFYVMGVSQRLMQRISAINPDQVFYTDFSACNAYANGELAAQSVNCPVLFLLGKKDMMTPAKASQTLSRAIPHSQQKIIENCGHSLMSEQPEQVLSAIHEFVRA
ncbi:alpha/beta hydrolase [Undibacterium sp. TS12]|uniref:alpha/beta fold hydrolase n=1 Tax=Undibacterium sp. TS12 TaxID=2908202 RepID=UPI001F4C570E|nr:alpha/beta hydrolase [Undibacterium sp. TS12]MCH8618374.1 alpha/beta hydrolase [Undibacterium sp. TS12]